MAKRNVDRIATRTGKYNAMSDLKGAYVPHTIYYYYVKSTTNRATNITAYDKAILFIREESEPITEALLKSKHIPELTTNARRATPNNPKPSGKGFGSEPWRRRSYLVVALDDADGNNGFETDNAVEIARKKGSKRHQNHCFFDGGEGQIAVPGPSPIWAMWTVNYMKGRSGEDIPAGKVHTFGFKFRPKKRRPIVDDPEDHGTNMGPPVGPP